MVIESVTLSDRNEDVDSNLEKCLANSGETPAFRENTTEKHTPDVLTGEGEQWYISIARMSY